MPGAWLQYEPSHHGAWHVASSIVHTRYCMLRSIDSVCVNVNLRALFQLPAGTDVTQRSHREARHRRVTPPTPTPPAGGGGCSVGAGASTFDISRGAQARSR